MQEIKINSGFGRYPVKDPITPPPTPEAVEEELKKFPIPFWRLTIGFVMGVFVALTFAQYWQNKHYGELIRLQEVIKSDISTMERNTEQVKWLVTRNEELANNVDNNVLKLSDEIAKLRIKRGVVVNK